jgi:hypothetical protein
MIRFLLAGRMMGSGKGRVYRTYLSVLLAVACVPVLILSAVIYFVGTYKVSQEITSIQQKQIMMNALKMEEYFSSVELLATQWAQNQLFSTRIKDLEERYDYQYILQIYNALFTLEGSNPLIQQAYLYMDHSSTLINHGGGVRRIEDPVDAERLHAALLSKSSSAYWLTGLDTIFRSNQSPILMYRLPIDTEQPYAALIFVLNEKVMQRGLSELSLSHKGLSLLLNEKGMILSQLYEGEQFEALKQVVIQEFSTHAHLPKNRQIRVGHDEYLLSFGQLSRLGEVWTYVNATSLTEMTRPVTFLSQLLLLLGLVGIAVAIVLSIVASKTVYRPIERMLQLVRPDKDSFDKPGDEIRLIEHQWHLNRLEMNQIREKLDEQRPEARAGFLLQLMLGYTDFEDEQVLKKRMRRLGWIVDEGCLHRVILFRLQCFSNSNKRFLKGDEQLATFAAANIIDEISGLTFPHHDIVNFQDLTVAMLATEFAEPSGDGNLKDLYEMSGYISEAIGSILDMQISIVIGKAVRSITEIPGAFEESHWLLSQRKPSTVNSIIDAQDYVVEEDQTIYYPFGLEQEIIQALRRGEKDLVALRVEQFCREIEEQDSREKVYYQCLVQLLGTIRSHMLRMGFNPFGQPDSSAPYEQLVKMGDTQAVASWFRDAVIGPFLEAMRLRDTRHDHRLQSLVESIIEKVNTDYA